MRKFIVTFLIFIAMPIGLALPLDYLVSGKLKQRPDFAQGEIPVWNDLYGGTVDSDLVVYGSSRAWVHFDPAILSEGLGYPAYNLGIDGSNFGFQYFRHEILLSNNKKPKYILMSVDAFSFQKKEGLSNSKQLLPFMLFNHQMYNGVDHFKGFSAADYYLPFARYVKNPSTVLDGMGIVSNGNPGLIRTRGFKGIKRNWNDDFEKAKKKLGSFKVKIDSTLIDLFDRFLAECKEKGIEVIFVYAPEHVDGQEFVKNRKQIVDTFDRFSKKYELAFLDYSRDRLTEDRKYFYNSSHLNKLGSELFTRKLVKDLISTSRTGAMRDSTVVPIIKKRSL